MKKLFSCAAATVFLVIHVNAASSSSLCSSVIQPGSVTTIVYEISELMNVSVWIDDEGKVNAEQHTYTQHGDLAEQCIGKPMEPGSFLEQNKEITIADDFRYTIYAVLISASVAKEHARILTDAIYPRHYWGRITPRPLLEIPVRKLSFATFLEHFPCEWHSSDDDRSSRSSSISPQSSPRERQSPLSSPRLPLSSPTSSPRGGSSSDSPQSSPRAFKKASASPNVYLSGPLSLSDGSKNSDSSCSPLRTAAIPPQRLERARRSSKSPQPSVPDALLNQSLE